MRELKKQGMIRIYHIACETDLQILFKTIGINSLQMTLTVKVQLGDKLFKLSSGVKTLEQVQHQMLQRFPKKAERFIYLFEEEVVQDLQSLLESLEKKGKTSIKLIAQPASFRKNSEVDNSMISLSSQEKQSLPQETINEIKEEKVEVPPPEPLFDMPQQFYVCYNCQGKGIYVHQNSINLCEVCRGKGQYDNTHKVVKHFKKLLQLQPNLQQPEKVEQKQMRKESLRVNKLYDVRVQEYGRISKIEIEKPFFCNFTLKNTGDDWPCNVIAVDYDTKAQHVIPSLRSGEQKLIELGPYTCQDERTLYKSFFLCYKQDEEMIRFGYKFGCNVRGFKPIQVKVIETASKQLIRQLKQMSGSTKSEEYLTTMLNQMGIDLNNLTIDDESLFEIINQIK